MRKILMFRLHLLMVLMLLMPLSGSAAEIAVTLPPLAGLVSMLDKKADIMCLLPAGADPHHFQLSPRKIEALNNSRLLVRAGVDDAGWPLPPSHSLALKLWPHSNHAWLDPESVRHILPKVAETLTRLHPENALAIAASLKHALNETYKIEQSWRTVLTVVKVTGVLMQHPAWQSLMQSMDVPILAVLESTHHGHEMGPHKLESALTTLNQHRDAWLLSDRGHSNKALDWLAQHADQPVRRITLDALGACGLPWPELMHRNMAQFSAQTQP